MYYLGLDSGSVSLKSVIIDEKGKIVKSSYIKNYNLMITLKETLKQIKIDEKIAGVGITGTGQEFISKIIGGDISEPETVAHYEATITQYPDVRTILDIGGQDSKLMIIDKNGLLKNIAFNKMCGGGTGGFIELIAEELDVKLNDVGDLALQSKNDFPFAGKCGVFARTSVIDRKNKGVAKEDILMGVCKALVNNYFAILGKGKNLLPPFVFQGATAKNKALVKCMEDELKHKISVPKNPHLMGAYGTALITQKDFKGKTNFGGFELMDADLETATFICGGCTNNCEVTQIYENKCYIGSIGSRCGKWNNKEKDGIKNKKEGILEITN
jgi:predicted CoA-substrate-specific enzyme activase|tara:strand:+ start:11621 stop:12604 length:984 start_codon:yes stop_codon:yes gene_type:complete